MTLNMRVIAFIAGAVLALIPSRSRAQDQPTPAAEPNTSVVLPSGRTMTLVGRWKIENALWGNHALVLGHGHLDVLEPGEAITRPLVTKKYDEVLSGSPVFGADGKTVYKWIDQHRQLVAIDVSDGTLRTLTNLEHRGSFLSEGDLAATPVYQGPAAIEDIAANKVWFVINRGSKKPGGWLCAVDRTGADRKLTSEFQITTGSVESWVFSRRLGKVFASANEDGVTRLYSIALDGNKESLKLPRFCTSRLALAPDEGRLLIERDFVDMEAVKAAVKAKGGAGAINIQVESSRDGGFAILNLDSEEVVEGPARGHEAAFTPDGMQVVYQFHWELRRFSIATATDEAIAVVSQGASPLEKSPSYYAFPIWSPDGRTFVVNVGESDCTQVVDIESKRIFLAPGDHGWDFAWAPAGTKFAPR